ncbi:hypothetical protein PR048_029624 [Dryococelus australis]|uniref:Uncharacterized protein n=1 Tax=Dryococelus australis TaxID=614101 RepID=A0ABQ9GGF2_9NEOP|nr:hypothetical protein PR048_029624 [Dryococelus australis]
MQGQGITRDPRENSLTSGIVRHDSHVRKSGSNPAGNQTRFDMVGGERSNHSAIDGPSVIFVVSHLLENPWPMRNKQKKHAQSSLSTVAADNQWANDICTIAHKTVESSLKDIQLANFSPQLPPRTQGSAKMCAGLATTTLTRATNYWSRGEDRAASPPLPEYYLESLHTVLVLTGVEIEMKFFSNHQFRRFEISIRDQQPSEKYAYFYDVIYYEPIVKFVSYVISISHFETKIDESEIQNHEISLVQHFYIGTKIELDPVSELGSFDLGSGKMLVQPGIRRLAEVHERDLVENTRWGEREIPEKTRRPTASSGTIPICEHQGVTRQGVEPGSHWWEASRPTAQPPCGADWTLHTGHRESEHTSPRVLTRAAGPSHGGYKMLEWQQPICRCLVCFFHLRMRRQIVYTNTSMVPARHGAAASRYRQLITTNIDSDRVALSRHVTQNLHDRQARFEHCVRCRVEPIMLADGSRGVVTARRWHCEVSLRRRSRSRSRGMSVRRALFLLTSQPSTPARAERSWSTHKRGVERERKRKGWREVRKCAEGARNRLRTEREREGSIHVQKSALQQSTLPPARQGQTIDEKEKGGRGGEETRAFPLPRPTRGRTTAGTTRLLMARLSRPHLICTVQRHGGNTARLARRSDEALEVRVSVARITPSLLDLNRGGGGHPTLNKTEILRQTKPTAMPTLQILAVGTEHCASTEAKQPLVPQHRPRTPAKMASMPARWRHCAVHQSAPGNLLARRQPDQ